MAIDTISLRSRRALLAGTVGGLAAAVAGSLGRAQPVVAHDPDDVRKGAPNTAINATSITNTATDGDAFTGAASGGGIGIRGTSHSGAGVLGSTSASGVFGVGVEGYSPAGVGVSGASPSGIGVEGFSESSTLRAVLGISFGDNTGMQGYSGSGLAPASPAKTGVHGYAAQDDTARGVTGETTVGRGVNGIATSGVGVFGQSMSSVGVYGVSDSYVGVKAYSSSNSALYGQSDTGYAVEALGRLKFSTAGIATIPAGSTTNTMISYLLTAESFLLLTPGVDIGTRRLWFTKNVAAHTITIHVSSSRTTPTKVSWLLLG
jgi:hypothetical protein